MRLVGFVAACACLGGLWGCNEHPTPHEQRTAASEPSRASVRSGTTGSEFVASKVEYSGSAMGTSVTFIATTKPGLSEEKIQDAIKAALKEIQRLEALMSSWRPESDVSRINAHPGQFVSVSPETLAVVQKGLWAGRQSEGTFDVTFQTLSGLWKFGDAGDAKPSPPDPREVERLRHFVDFRKVEVKQAERKVKIGPKQQLGLGGIAKGYIVDAAAHVLSRAGVRDFLVRAGGDLFGSGRKPSGEPWVAGIQDPRGKHDDYFATIELTDHAFSTAGDYARAYTYRGKRYHHIIDPRTGYPATESHSVTVWAETALLADAIDDGVFILGPNKGLELVESIPGVGAVIVDKDNKVWVSARLKGRVRILHQPTPGK